MEKDDRINFRISKGLRAAILKAAAGLGLAEAQYIRLVLEAQTGYAPPAKPKVTAANLSKLKKKKP